MKKEALIIIDVQNNYFEGGYNELYHPVETTEHIKEVLDQFRDAHQLIVFIQHRFSVSGDCPKEKEWYVQINDRIQPRPDEIILQKDVPNSFHETGLLDVLKNQGVGDLVIVGMMSHMCVDTTVRAAFDYGFSTILIEDACCTKDMSTKHGVVDAQTVHDVFMESLGQVFAKIMTTEEYISSCK